MVILDVRSSNEEQQQQSSPSPQSSLPLHGNNTTASATATAPTSAASSSDDNCDTNQSDKALSSKISSTERRYRIVALSVLILILVFGAGFGVGISRCPKCQACVSESGNSNETETTADETTTTNFAPGKTVQCNDNYDSGTDDSNSNGNTNLPPAIEPSFVPPFASRPGSISCDANRDAMNELRAVVQRYTRSYIYTFARYIRMGGNNSIVPEWNEDYVETEADILEWMAMMASNDTGTGSYDTDIVVGTRLRNHWRSRKLATSAMDDAAAAPAAAGTEFTALTARQHVVSSARRAASSNSATGTTFAGSTPSSTSAKEADMVQTNGRCVYMVYNGDEILVVQAATSAIQRRIRVPKRYAESTIAGLLLLILDTADNASSTTTYNQDSDTEQEEVLVVLVQEWDELGGVHQRTLSNTTVLLYTVNSANAQLTLARRHSIPGAYKEAFAVARVSSAQRHDLHVVTTRDLHLLHFSEYLTPAYLQGINVSSLIANGLAPPPLRLSEAEYRELAFEQQQVLLDDFVPDLAASLDCTGFAALSGWSGRNETNVIVSSEAQQFLYVTSLDIGSDVLASTTGSPVSGSSPGISTLSMIPPDGYYETTLVSDTMLLVTGDPWSGRQFTNTSHPMTWLLVVQLWNATAVPMPVAGLVPGALYYSSSADHFQTNQRDYLCLITSRYDNVWDFDRQWRRNPNADSIPVHIVILDVTDANGRTQDSTMNGSISSTTLPVVADWLMFQLLNGSSIVKTMYHDDRLFVAECADSGGDTNAVAAAVAPFCTLYTLDTVSDPTNPRLVGQPQEVAGVRDFNLFVLNEQWMLGTSSSSYSDKTSFQLHLFNISDNRVDALGRPTLPARLVQTWKGNSTTLTTSLNGTTSKAQEVMYHVTESSFYSYGAKTMTLQHMADDSIMLVMPGRTDRYMIKPCQSNDDDAWRDVDDDVWTHNESVVARFNDTCQYDQTQEFDGFWVFKIGSAKVVPAATTAAAATSQNGSIPRHYITKHFAIDHASPDLMRPGCFAMGFDSPRSLIFNGDVMTLKSNTVLSHDVLTKVEAAPPLVLLECPDNGMP